MNKIIKYGWRLLLIVPLILAFGAYVNNDNQSIQSNQPICPDDFKDPKLEIASFTEWANKFWENNPNATTLDFSQARVNFLRENNCTQALKRYDDYMAGNVDKETQQLIEMTIKQSKNK